LEKLEKEKENVFHFILGFWPIGLAASRFLPRLLLVGRSAFPSREQRAARFPAPPWAELPQARHHARAAVFPLLSISR
jgi:hypothetical protein